MLARLTDVLSGPGDGGAVGAFNLFSLEHAEAIVDGAEAAGHPVVLQISQNSVAYHRALEPVAVAALALARRAAVPVVVHLDHASDRALVDEAVALGLGSVMYDGSALPYDQNLAQTRAVVEACHAAGLDVEAELGEVGGKDGVHAPTARTEPAEARAFVVASGVDALAVAVGSSHAMHKRTASLDLDLIARLRGAVDVPLVLHGSSGVPDDELRLAVAAGIRKVNIATHLNAVFTAAVRAALTGAPNLVDSRRYLGPARDAMAREVTRLLVLLAEAGADAE